jgi:hypothetical protein
MPVEKTEWEIGTLIGAISHGEIKLPEIQRGFVWKPTQVAKLIDSLYRGYPTGSLLFWRTMESPLARDFALVGTPPQPAIQPLYLLDGQQRLTALSRALGPDEATEIVFNVSTQAFQNQSAATARNPLWVKVRDVTRPGAPLYKMANALHTSVPELDPDEIAPRLQRLAAIRAKKYTMEILSGFEYEEITQIFVRVNSGGRALRTTDLALATLSARWPGILDKLETEADYWAKHGYGDIDATFLTRALTGAVLGRGLSTWSHARLVAATDEQLERGWATVQRGLRDLVALLKNNLKISQSSLLPSMIVLLPLIVLLGERPDEPLPIETANALLYWLLVATIRNRYSSATDTTLGQDIPAARLPDPTRELLKNLGIVGTRIEVTLRDLAGRSVNSPYFLLSFLVAQRKEARDWWYATVIAPGGSGPQKLEYHHIHPRARLAGQPEKYTKAEINDLANYAFISAKANKKISDRSPVVYFPTLGTGELDAHFVPLDVELRTAAAYRDFLAARRRLLASAMTSLLDKFCPPWLSAAVVALDDPLAGSELDFTAYQSDWDVGRIVATAKHAGSQWTAVIALPDLESALDAASEGLASDITVGGEALPVIVDDDGARIPIGPFLVTGTVDDWRTLLARERAETLPLSQCPATDIRPWTAERLQFPVANID